MYNTIIGTTTNRNGENVMNNNQESYTMQKSFVDAAAESTVLEDSELLILQARSDDSLLAALTGKGRALRKHEAEMTRIYYKGQVQELELLLTSRIKAMREMANHWLRQGGFFLRRQTAAVAVAEYKQLEAVVIDYLSGSYARAKALKAEAENYSGVPGIQRRWHRMIEKLLDDSEAFIQGQVENFQAMMQEKV